MTNLKELIGTKFLFDKNLIEYKDLVKLLNATGLNTDFIQKPINDKLEVHSLYIKPDFEVSFLVKSNSADEYYKTAGYSCINYKEINLYDVLKLLGYYELKGKPANVQSQKDQKENKPKKSKFVTFEYEKILFSYKKKYIKDMRYFKETKLLLIKKEDNEIKLENVDINLYNYIISQL